MALTLHTPSKSTPPPHRAIIYGRPGFGKSRLALSLPDTEEWGEILYYAADEGSEDLTSVDPKYVYHADGTRRIHVLKPDTGDSGLDSPLLNFNEFSVRNWRKEKDENGNYPFAKVKTLVIDTYTKIANDVMSWSANTHAVTAEKHFNVGDPKNGGQVIPNRGDYMAVASVSRGFLNTLFEHQREMNIIYVMHEEMSVIEGVGAQGGPAHPGRQMTEELPAKFPTVIRVDRRTEAGRGGAPSRKVVVAITESAGQYLAKFRENGTMGNPIPEVVLDVDPVNFWVKFSEAMAKINGQLVPKE
jgi:hypothetical protein